MTLELQPWSSYHSCLLVVVRSIRSEVLGGSRQKVQGQRLYVNLCVNQRWRKMVAERKLQLDKSNELKFNGSGDQTGSKHRW